MGQFTRDGVIYEEMPNGKVRVVGYDTPLADPRLASQTVKAQNEAAASAYDPAKAAADVRIAELNARIKEIEAGSAGATTQADLEKARLEVQKLQAEIQQLQTGKNGALNALQTQVDRVGELHRNYIRGGVPNIVNNLVPDFLQPSKGQFDAAAQGLTNPFMAAFKVPGQGSQSDLELRQFLAANTPSQGDSDAVIEEKIRNIQTRIDAEKEARGITPSAQLSGPTNDQDGFAQSQGATRTEVDPALKALGQRVGRMIANGGSDEQVREFLRKNGVDPVSTNVEGILEFRRTPDFKTWQRANPGKAYPIGPDFYTKEIPLTGARRLFNKTASTDAGGAVAAGLASSANAISGGRLDNVVGALSGDPEMARTGMMLLRTNHPGASLAGDFAGQASLDLATGRIPGMSALMNTKWGRRLEDLVYGAYSGSGENDDDPLSGAATGAATNLGFGMFGRSAQRGIGRVATGVRNPDLRLLHNEGVPMSVGQIARGADNVAGDAVGGIEERALGLPGLDAVIGAARQRGDEGFNRAVFRRLGTSGETGAKGIDEGQQLVGDAYSFLDPVNIPLDAQFAGSQAAVRAGLPNLPAFGPQIGKSLDMMDRSASGGALTGRGWQDALRSTKGNRASIRGKEFSDDAVSSLTDVENNLLDLAARQGPPGTAGNLQSANRLNAQFQTIVDALDNGPTQRRGELFSPTRLNDASRANARNFGGQVGSMKGNRPFYDLTKAGMAVMPNLTPDSGTAGRILLVPALASAGGAGYGFLSGDDKLKDTAQGGGSGLGYGALAAAALSAPYSKTGQRIIQNALLKQRPRDIEKLGEYLINHPRLSGMFGSAIGRDLIYQPELP